MQGKTCREINIGDTARFSKTVSESDVYNLAGVTGDMNPAHIDKEYASKGPFGRRVAHGILPAGLISNVMGMQLPGQGSIYLKQDCQFLKPVFIGDTITAVVEVIRKDETSNRITLRTYCHDQNGEIVIDGNAEVMPPGKPGKNSKKVEIKETA